ncbi:MAG TPA: hemerythrin domain-containing protein [Rudaea sp.]|jgi:hemerythrin-like domain-containing protein|nr:hemerythrin domain-containing protein [Rudaea sp.]
MGFVNTVKALSARATMDSEDVRALLKKDHDEAKALAKQMHEATAATRRMALLAKLKPALTAHSRAEERAVYTALLRVRSDDPSHVLADEGFVEHSLLDELLMTLASTDAGTDRWRANAKVLHELLEHHITEEQSDVFAKLGDHFERDQLEAMGAQFLREKADVLRGVKTPGRTAAPTRNRGAASTARATVSKSRKVTAAKRSGAAARKKQTGVRKTGR